ncbi:beta-ketoacyl synthase chain length factor [Pseudogulbenkiania sp. MAI-1]|uniref:beta-ketoacyl synthase chain length factor n=1 Tax=Pseudogulbenkiania sp. MAI-1 TaxID=990370 RepID=UPI00045EA4BB|nr:beta-ketoacyl synthase chain length factor [Pseudogulbenkiania sp. MAI-1]
MSGWAAWSPLASEPGEWRALRLPAAVVEAVDFPACRFVEAGLRRRLSPLARMTLHVARQCAADRPELRVVFASRHGEVNRTHLMLEALAGDEELSPTLFSLSVHNAIAGLLSIIRRDTAPATAVAAGAESLGAGLLQAALEQMACPEQPVLLLYADLPLLPFYRDVDPALQQPLALAMLLQAGGEPWRLSRDSGAQADGAQGVALAQALAGAADEAVLAGRRLARA